MTNGTIPIGGSTNISVTLSPTTNGSYSGWVVVYSDATVGSNSNSISGTGISVPITTNHFPIDSFDMVYSFPYSPDLGPMVIIQ